MSLDTEYVITTTQDEQTNWVLRNLHKTFQFRTKADDDLQKDQYRSVLRVVISRDLEGITDIATIYHYDVVTTNAIGPLIPKGGETEIQVETATGGDGAFSAWHLTAQRFDEIQQDGGKLYRETREYVAVSNDETDGSGNFWEDFSWFSA